jgi:O-antigen/teichoic acid export membrane protein
VAVLGLTAGARDAGQYVAGSAIAVGIGAICIGISYALLPALSQQNESEARETLRRVLRVLIPMCTVVSCVLVLLARDAIGLVYGFAEDQTETVAVFRILILGLPFLVAGRCLQIGLVALGNNVLVLWTQALGAAVSVLAVTVGYFVSGVRGVAVGAVGAYVAIAIAGWVGFVRASDVRQATESV